MIPKELVALSQIEVDQSQPFFCDTETIGLYGKVRLFQCYQKHWPKVKLVEYPNQFELALFTNQNNTVWHNAHYDLSTIASGLVPPQYEDTLLLSRLSDPLHMEYTLDAVMTRALGYDPYEAQDLDKKVLQKSDWSATKLSEEQLDYAATDVYYMPQVWDKIKPETFEDFNYKLDKLVLNHCLKMQLNGMPVDGERHALALTEAHKNLDKLMRKLPVNPNSPKQVKEWLGMDSTGALELMTAYLEDGNENAKLVVDARKTSKLISFLEKRYDREIVTGYFKPYARSGRLTSSDDNLQQIPRALKKIFGYQKDAGRVILYADYPQLELRTICAALRVSLLEQLFREGTDVHKYVMYRLFGDSAGKEERTVTKTYNFNLLYGGSVGMIISILIGYGLLLKHNEASRHKKKWLRLFPEIDSWQQSCIKRWRRGESYSTPSGRKYKAKLMTDFMNIFNQGAGADVSKLAFHYIMNFIADSDEDILCHNFIHDSFILSCPDDPSIYKPLADKIAEHMQTAWFEISKFFHIENLPMPIEVKVGYNWDDLEEDKEVLYESKLEGMEFYNAES